MATLGELETTGLKVTSESVQSRYGGIKETKEQYLIELPEGTTLGAAQDMVDKGLTKGNFSNSGVAPVQRDGKTYIVVPQNQLYWISKGEIDLFKKQVDAAVDAKDPRIVEAKQVMREMAKSDGDAASISLDDYKALTPEKAAKLDIDGDGKVTKADIAKIYAEKALTHKQKQETIDGAYKNLVEAGVIKEDGVIKTAEERKIEPAADKKPTLDDVAKTEDEKSLAELMQKAVKDGKLNEVDGKKMAGLIEKVGTEKATEIAKAVGMENPDLKAKAGESLNGYQEAHKADADKKKTKAEIISEMFADGNFIGAILAMIFMPETEGLTQKDRVEQTKANVDKGTLPAKSAETDKDAGEANKGTEPKAPEAKDNVVTITYDKDGAPTVPTKVNGVDLTPEQIADAKAHAGYLYQQTEVTKAEQALKDAELKRDELVRKQAEGDKSITHEQIQAAKNDVKTLTTKLENEKDDLDDPVYKDSRLTKAEAERDAAKQEIEKLKAEKEQLQNESDALAESNGKNAARAAELEIERDGYAMGEYNANKKLEQKQELDKLLQGRKQYMDEHPNATVFETAKLDRAILALDPTNGQTLINEQNAQIKVEQQQAQFVKDQTQKLDKLTGELEYQKGENGRLRHSVRDAYNVAGEAIGEADKLRADANIIKSDQKQNDMADQYKKQQAVVSAVMGLNNGEGNDGQDLTTARDNVPVKDGKVSDREVTSSNANLNPILNSIANLDGQAGISEADAKQAAAILNEMQQAGQITEGAKKTITTKMAAATKNTGMAL